MPDQQLRADRQQLRILPRQVPHIRPQRHPGPAQRRGGHRTLCQPLAGAPALQAVCGHHLAAGQAAPPQPKRAFAGRVRRARGPAPTLAGLGAPGGAGRYERDVLPGSGPRQPVEGEQHVGPAVPARLVHRLQERSATGLYARA